MAKRILVLDGHPDQESFCAAMAAQYVDGAKEAGYTVEILAVRNLVFDPVLHYGYRKVMDLEPDLLITQEAIKQCEHLVIITPVWWGNIPALFKGFFDRAFISGFSHRFNVQIKRPEGLLKGRSASVLYTQGSPWFYSLLVRRDSFWKTLKGSILDFCGFHPVKRKYFDKVKSGTDADRHAILEKAYELGKRGF